MSGLMPRLNSGNKLYEEERKQADDLPHRSHDLETAIANLQLGPLAPRVHEILDRYRAEMRPVQEQGEGDRIWRLALHRMDLRQYTVADDAPDPAQMLIKGNTIFLLEVILQRYVYGRPLELKRQSNLRDAILMLLDMLVEQGSSAAFRMRDDFVTPAS